MFSVVGSTGAAYGSRMRIWLRPRSRSFRAVFGLALLAWMSLAAGALAGPLQMSMDMLAAMPATAAQVATQPCDGMSMQAGAARPAPVAPNGHGDCCHDECHCLSVCNTVLAVPHLMMAVPLPHARMPLVATVGLAQMPEMPPLRPPIA